MAAPYSEDLRHRVLGAYDRGMRTKAIAEHFQVSASWARRIKQRRRENGEASARPMGGKRFEKIDRRRLATLVEQQPDATLEELRDRLGIVCAISAICAALKQIRVSLKKRRPTRPSRTARMWPSIAPGGRSSASALIRAG